MYFVHREGVRTDLITGVDIPTTGWVGPMDSAAQADREAHAWRSAGYAATVHPDTPEVRARIAAWEDAAIDAWQDSCDTSQRNRWQERETARRLAAQDSG